MTVKTDVVAEYTGGSGVTIDGVLIKDGSVDGVDVSAVSTAVNDAAQAIPHAGTLMLPQTMEYANGGVYNVRSYGASPSAAAATNTAAFHAAINAAAEGGAVEIPDGKYYIAGGLSFNDAHCSFRGSGLNTILECVAQTGPVLDMTGYAPITGDFDFGMEVGGFRIIGDGAADATKTHTGITLKEDGSRYPCNLYFHDISISGTGGPGLNIEEQCVMNVFDRITVHEPIGASTNDVPYVRLNGICNGNVFNNLTLRHDGESSVDGATACLLLEGNGVNYSPTRNKFYNLQAENMHIPENGSVVLVYGSANEFYGTTDWDSRATTRTTTNTTFFRFVANAYSTKGGNLVMGVTPKGAAGTSGAEWYYLAYGVILEGDGNSVIGVNDLQFGVLLAAGVKYSCVIVTGSVSSATAISCVRDISGETSNTIINSIAGTWTQAGRTTTYATAAPTTGAGSLGDIVWNSAPSVGQALGWICTHPGAFSTSLDTGNTDGSTGVITNMNSLGFLYSDFIYFGTTYVDVSAGFASTGPFRVVAVDAAAKTLTVDALSNAIASGVTVNTSDPVWTPIGVAWNGVLDVTEGIAISGSPADNTMLMLKIDETQYTSGLQLGALKKFGTSIPGLWFNLGAALTPGHTNYALFYDGNVHISAPTGALVLEVAATPKVHIKTEEAVFNDSAADFDFRVETDSSYNAINVDASANSIAIMEHASGAIGFFGTSPIARPLLATGAGATVDNVITVLQNLGLVKQS